MENLKYEKVNRPYQRALDQAYSGKVTVKEKYINPRAVLIHYCKDCDRDFYAKPLWIASGKQPHECYTDLKNLKEKSKKTGRKRITQDEKEKMVVLHKQGLAVSKIAKQLGTSYQTVRNHLNKAGLV